MKGFLFLAGTLLLLLTACEYEFIEPEKITPPPAGDTISFTQDVIPFFTAKCATCHRTGAVAPDLTAANAYTALTTGNFVVAGNPSTSELYIVCKTGGSMASYTSSDELKLIYRWIFAGAKNN